MIKTIESEPLSIERTARNVLTCCFFFSGLTGLLYEIVWVRLFALVFGNAVYSTATVLMVFMGGLGAGGWWFGRFIEKRKSAIMFYGIVEIIIGLYAFIPPLLIKALESVYPQLYHAAVSQPALIAIKAVAAAAILAIPTFCMGATLPLMSKFFVARRDKLSISVSFLYGLNTIGAVTGAFLTGFYLLALMGVTDTLKMGMVLNIGIGLLAIVQHQKMSKLNTDETETATPAPGAGADALSPAGGSATPLTGAASRGFFIPLLLCGAFASGFVSFLLEVTWTRSLALIIGSSVYSFTLILLAFLIGIALGSFSMGRFMRSRPDRIISTGFASIATCFLLIAVASASYFPMLKWAFFLFMKTMNMINGNYNLILILQFIVCGSILFAPAFLFGASFPAIISLYTMKTGAVSAGVGRIYFWNTLGAILGSALTGFILLPLIGLRPTLLIGVLAMLGMGVVFSAFEIKVPVLKRFAAAAAVSAAVFFISFSQPWDSYLMTSGPFLYHRNYNSIKDPDSISKSIKQNARLIYYRDGATVSVAVLKEGDNMFLKVNGKTDASSFGDAHTQIFLAAMPLLIHPNPQKVAVIGLGSGMSAGTVLQFPSVRSVDAIEIEPYVVEADRLFENKNFHFLDDKRTRIHIEDARNYLLANSDKYDVIISEPSNHWIAGIANLYSQDFFKLTKSRLRAGGIYCQWVQLYSMAPKSLSMILATYQSVYPYVYAFLVENDLFLIGSEKPIQIDAREIARRFDSAQLAAKLKPLRPGFDRLGITAAHFVAGPNEIRKLSAGSRLHTDDRPFLEFAAPFEFFEPAPVLANMITSIYPVDPLASVGLDARKLTASEYFGIANDVYNTKIDRSDYGKYLEIINKLSPDNPAVLFLSAEYFSSIGLSLLADDYYNLSIKNGAGRQAQLSYLMFLIKQQEFKKAETLASLLSQSQKDDIRILNAQAIILKGLGRYEESALILLRYANMVKEKKAKSSALFDAAKYLLKTENPDKSKIFGILVEANRLDPLNPNIAFELAKILSDSGNISQAEMVLFRVYKVYPEILEINLLMRDLQSRVGGVIQ